MIDPIQATTAPEHGRLSQPTASGTRTAATSAGASFAGQLARFVSTPAESVKPAARPDNEQTKKVSGHPYSRVQNGDDKGLYLNQLEGNPRAGTVFKLVERDDRVFHVYGTGREKVVVEVKADGRTGAGASTGGATPTTT